MEGGEITQDLTPATAAHYDFETVHAITDASLVSHVSFIAADDNGEPTPITLPLTAVLGWYGDGDGDGPEVSDAELARQQQVVMRQGLMDVYLHGNAAAMLYRAIRDSAAGTVNVCICSTKGEFVDDPAVVFYS